MAIEVGDRVDLKSGAGTVPEGRYEVIRHIPGRRVVIREIETGKQRIVSIDDLVGFMRPGSKIDWP